ncbi:MAG: hypothetical protein SFZ02_12325 [bacterium]|nr:hypothetical protein [bacterium]
MVSNLEEAPAPVITSRGEWVLLTAQKYFINPVLVDDIGVMWDAQIALMKFALHNMKVIPNQHHYSIHICGEHQYMSDDGSPTPDFNGYYVATRWVDDVEEARWVTAQYFSSVDAMRKAVAEFCEAL